MDKDKTGKYPFVKQNPLYPKSKQQTLVVIDQSKALPSQQPIFTQVLRDLQLPIS